MLYKLPPSFSPEALFYEILVIIFILASKKAFYCASSTRQVKCLLSFHNEMQYTSLAGFGAMAPAILNLTYFLNSLNEPSLMSILRSADV